MTISLRQVLNSVWNKSFHSNTRFEEIIGHENIKIIFNKAILSRRPVHILLVGKPGTAKTMFLTEVMRSIKQSYFIVGSNSTKAGLIDMLFERKPKFLLIDELDKMNAFDQASLLHLMETGIISETKIKKTREMELTSWVFATANSVQKIIEPLLSRFVVLEIPEYTFDEFVQIATNRLTKEGKDKRTAVAIAHEVWSELGSKDIRDVMKIGRLVDNNLDILILIKMMKRKANCLE
jgi:Holliday junction DNA helicase RuvB